MSLRAGPCMALTGYRDAAGLSASLIDLRRDGSGVASTFVLDNRFKSGNRSHSFNSRIAAEGRGLIGRQSVRGIRALVVVGAFRSQLS